MKPHLKQNFDFTVILEPQPDGGFTVSVPALPEVVTEGETEAEALKMAEEAIRAVLEYRRDHGSVFRPSMPGASLPRCKRLVSLSNA